MFHVQFGSRITLDAPFSTSHLATFFPWRGNNIRFSPLPLEWAFGYDTFSSPWCISPSSLDSETRYIRVKRSSMAIHTSRVLSNVSVLLRGWADWYHSAMPGSKEYYPYPLSFLDIKKMPGCFFFSRSVRLLLAPYVDCRNCFWIVWWILLCLWNPWGGRSAFCYLQVYSLDSGFTFLSFEQQNIAQIFLEQLRLLDMQCD